MNQRAHTNTVWSIWAPLTLLFLALLFSTYITSRHETEIQALATREGVPGMGLYVFVTALAVVVAPFSTMPLVPLASMMWGWVPAALLTIVGWVIGAQIAFIIAQRYGKALLIKFISLEQLNMIEARIPKQNLFLGIVLLRMTLPVDILSYALGALSSISSSSFFLATVIGVTPGAFIFAYMGTFSFRYALLSVLVGVLIYIVYVMQRKGK